MKSPLPTSLLFIVAVLGLSLTGPARAADDAYAPGPDSRPQAGVPRGTLLKYEFTGSQIFPGTVHHVTVYVPQQYDPAKPACVYVNQDGVQSDAPTVFDNLIAKHEIPVLVGVFVTPGVVPARDPVQALDRYNRSFEYDGLGDAYVRFLLDEVLPDVERRVTPDGRPIRLSHSGNDRAIGGTSSGAICAFTAAWERPDAFSRVFSGIGTYVGLRGGNNYPTLIRKFEPKPIRIFLQDGSDDLNIYGGDWWMANQTMERAFEFAGYEVNHVWGTLGHNNRHATAVFPEAIRWLWHGWPEPVKGGATKNPMLNDILIPGEGWQLVSAGHHIAEGPAVDAHGAVFFTDIGGGRIFKIGADGHPAVFVADSKHANGQAFGPDGRLYSVATATQQILAYNAKGEASVIADGIAGNDVVVARNGNIYVTNPPPRHSADSSRVWLIRPDGTKLVVDEGLRYANGVALSTDQSLLYVTDYYSHWVYSYQIQPDGTLADKQRYYWLHTADPDDMSYADGMCVDTDGRLYVTTKLGLQVCDQAGRVNAIIPTPADQVTNVTLGGENFDTLYATCFNHVYKRKVRVHGANAWAPPTKPEKPRL